MPRLFPDAARLANYEKTLMEANPYKLSRRDVLKLAGAAAAVAITPGARAAIAATPSAKAASTSKPAAAKLFMTDVGKGQNVMLLHGWTCDSNDWSWQLPLFQSKYRVIAPDLRGHGHSQVMPSGAYMPADYVADIEKVLAAKYNSQKFVVVGHSMGGQIAARLAPRRPDLVRAVVSVDGSLGFSGKAAQFLKKAAQHLQVDDLDIVVPALFKKIYAPTTEPALKSWHARRVEGMPADVVRESFAPLFEGPGQVGTGEASAKFCRSLTVPFYHMCRDPAQATRMRPWFSHPKSKVDLWPHSGHWIMQDQKEALNAAATAWIDAL
jgi:pimeloyl-ACP methyl ester carboxylesterase